LLKNQEFRISGDTADLERDQRHTSLKKSPQSNTRLTFPMDNIRGKFVSINH